MRGAPVASNERLRFAAKVTFPETFEFKALDRALCRLACETVVDRSTYYFATETLRDAFVKKWAA